MHNGPKNRTTIKCTSLFIIRQQRHCKHTRPKFYKVEKFFYLEIQSKNGKMHVANRI